MSEPLEYIPKQNIPVNNQAAPKPVYELKSSLIGKVKDPIVIGTKDIKVNVPYAPKSNCKKCMGKGYVGVDTKKVNIFICQKCYPNMILNKK